MRRCVFGACVCTGVFPLLGFVQPTAVDVVNGEVISLRVPGMTESFSLVRCPDGEIESGDEVLEIPELYVLTTEVTWDLYDIYVYKLDEPEVGSALDGVSRPSKPYVPPDRGFGHEGYPAIGMTRHAAEGFCDWLSLKTGLEIRLPTAEEWMHLARAERAGSAPLDEVAWYADNSAHSTHPVGEKQPNAFGLYDTLGNAAEWVLSDTRNPIAYGGGYRDGADACGVDSFQKEVSAWNQSDPQIPKSKWWLADCSWVGFRFVIEADSVNPEKLEELRHDIEESD